MKIRKPIKIILAAALTVILFATSAFAVATLLSAKEAADRLDNEIFSQAFSDNSALLLNESITDSGYEITLLGIASGEELYNINSVDVLESRSYVVLAMKKTDGTAMDYDHGVTFYPLFEGYEPWLINGLSLGGSRSSFIENGVLYCLYDYSEFEAFAYKTIYIAAGDSSLKETFELNDDGSIAYSDNYHGIKAIFKLPTDSLKADSDKAQKIVDEILQQRGLS